MMILVPILWVCFSLTFVALIYVLIKENDLLRRQLEENKKANHIAIDGLNKAFKDIKNLNDKLMKNLRVSKRT